MFDYKEFEFRNNSINFNKLIQSTNINQTFPNENNLDEEFSSVDCLANTSIGVKSTQYQMNINQNKKKQEWVSKLLIFV